MSLFLNRIYLYKLLLSHVEYKNKAFLFCLSKRCSPSRLNRAAPTNKKIGFRLCNPAVGYRYLPLLLKILLLLVSAKLVT